MNGNYFVQFSIGMTYIVFYVIKDWQISSSMLDMNGMYSMFDRNVKYIILYATGLEPI